MARLRPSRRGLALGLALLVLTTAVITGAYVGAGRIEMLRAPQRDLSATFPRDFLFGTATAAQQVEGADKPACAAQAIYRYYA